MEKTPCTWLMQEVNPPLPERQLRTAMTFAYTLYMVRMRVDSLFYAFFTRLVACVIFFLFFIIITITITSTTRNPPSGVGSGRDYAATTVPHYCYHRHNRRVSQGLSRAHYHTASYLLLCFTCAHISDVADPGL